MFNIHTQTLMKIKKRKKNTKKREVIIDLRLQKKRRGERKKMEFLI